MTRRVSEVAGGTTAECAAVCCCCPCALLNILVLAVYKLPAAVCRCLFRPKSIPPCRSSAAADGGEASQVKSLQWDKDVVRLEKEMLERFHWTGFWRTLSQRKVIDTRHAA